MLNTSSATPLKGHLDVVQPQTDDDTASEAASTCPVVPVLDSICFIGAGQVLLLILIMLQPIARSSYVWLGAQMGEALIRGFAVSGVSSTQRLSAASRSASRRQYLSDMGLASVHGDILQHTNAAAACSSDVLVLAVSCFPASSWLSLNAGMMLIHSKVLMGAGDTALTFIVCLG